MKIYTALAVLMLSVGVQAHDSLRYVPIECPDYKPSIWFDIDSVMYKSWPITHCDADHSKMVKVAHTHDRSQLVIKGGLYIDSLHDGYHSYLNGILADCIWTDSCPKIDLFSVWLYSKGHSDTILIPRGAHTHDEPRCTLCGGKKYSLAADTAVSVIDSFCMDGVFEWAETNVWTTTVTLDTIIPSPSKHITLSDLRSYIKIECDSVTRPTGCAVMVSNSRTGNLLGCTRIHLDTTYLKCDTTWDWTKILGGKK
jgi:hypothetical protein